MYNNKRVGLNCARNMFRRKTLVSFLIASFVILHQVPSSEAQCTKVRDLINLAEYGAFRSIDVGKQTCGLQGPEEFQGIDSSNSDLLTCDANNAANAYPESGLSDKNTLTDPCELVPNFLTQWRSINTVANGISVANEINIVVNFTDVFEIRTIRLVFGTTLSTVDPRPKAVSYEKYDALTQSWIPLRYEALDCGTSFDGIPTISSTSTAYCTNLAPSTSPPYLTVFNPAKDFANFFTDTTVRGRFLASALRIRLIAPPSMEPLRSGYAISDIGVDGVCACYDHQSNCIGPNVATCECGDNTMGDNCEQCLPLYNNKLWQPGPGFVCEKCQCNEYASSCMFDGLRGQGICQNCEANTMGDFCELCNPGFRRNPSDQNPRVNTTGLDVGQCSGFNGIEVINYTCSSWCVPCDCNINGTVGGAYTCEMNGQCACKPNVIGQKCDQCKDFYWDLQNIDDSGCKACNCDLSGTQNSSNLCDKTTGKCLCKLNTQGSSCEACKPQTYNLDVQNPDGCTPCDCDVGGASSLECNLQTGDCTCQTGLTGRDCRTPEQGRFVPKLDYFLFDAEFQSPQGTLVERAGNGEATATVTGSGFVLLKSKESITFSVTVAATGSYFPILRYESGYTWPGVQIAVTLQNGAPYTCGEQELPADQSYSGRVDVPASESKGSVQMVEVCLAANQSYNVVITLGDAAVTNLLAELLVDSIVLVPNVNKLPVYSLLSLADQGLAVSCMEAAYSVNNPQREALNCPSLEYSIMADLLQRSLVCSCGSAGAIASSNCDPSTGACLCQPGVMSPDCSRCNVYHSGGDNLANGCVACDCDPKGSASLVCNQTSICSCKTNVMGDKCSQCLPDFYGFQTGNGCQECTCNLNHSLSNSCADDGACPCNPGVSGQNCDVCAAGFFNLTSGIGGCRGCGCDLNGQTSLGCDKTTGICDCKARVDGNTCDLCKTGFYGLGTWHADGCLQCVCSGHSTNCTSAEGYYETITASAWKLSDSTAVDDPWLGEDENSKAVTVTDPTVFFSKTAIAQYVMRIINSPDLLKSQALYFLAPSKYLGNKKSAYGREFKFALSSSSLESLVTDNLGDVILKGRALPYSLVTKLPANPGNGPTEYRFILNEKNWKVDTTDGTTATFLQMIETLSFLEALKIRAKYSNKTDVEVDLYSASLPYSSLVNASGIPVNNVEKCVCPAGYDGSFCELCAAGYRRSASTLGSFGDCEPCQCNGHGLGTCDMETGKCTCTHNTGGNQCEICLTGFYGDATQGTADDCQPCMCPGNVVQGDVNVFASQCDSNGQCVNCTTGHLGNQCGTCEQGYYGNPSDPLNNNGKCVPCNCNGRADTCDSVTGVCENCRNNTDGKECDICAQPYFGDALTFNCELCNCNSTGATGNCDPSSGQCECKPNVEGFTCGQCMANSYNYSSGLGCTDCGCHNFGSDSPSCNLETGQCSCGNHVTGRQCNLCEDNFWRITTQGCSDCNCNIIGTAKVNNQTVGTCDLVSGQCQCALPGIIGRTCDTCSKASKLNFAYVNGIYIGTYPNCQLCGECYDSWAAKIDEVGFALDALNKEGQTIWSHYDNRLAADVEPIINQTATSLQSAQNEVVTSQGFLSLLTNLQRGYNQVQDKVSVTRSELDQLDAKRVKNAAELSSLKLFDGSVQTTAGVTKSIIDLETDINNEQTTQLNEFAKGNSSWFSMSNLESSVRTYDVQVSNLQERVRSAVTLVEETTNNRLQAQTLIGTQFNTSFQDNINNLQASKTSLDTLEALSAKLQQDVSTGESNLQSTQVKLQATQSILGQTTAGVLNIATANQFANSNATAADRMVTVATSQVDNFRAVADRAKSDLTKAVTDIAEGQSLISLAEGNVGRTNEYLQTIQVITIRPLSDMQNITASIRTLVIPDQEVQLANQEATNAQVVAVEIQQKVEEARLESNKARSEVDSINRNLDDAAVLRGTTQSLVSASTVLNDGIKAAITQVDTKASGAHELAIQTQNNVNLVSKTVKEMTRCFESIRASTGDVSQVVADAETLAATASQQHRANFDLVGNISSRLSELQQRPGYNLATQTNQAIDSLQTDLDAVNKIANLEELKATLTNQQTEMRTLQSDISQLESEIDSIILNLERFDPTTTNCVTN